MLSNRRLRANRVNAQKSTGPRSAAGLATSSQNAIRHGFSGASTVVLDGLEDAEEFERLRNDVVADLNAHGVVEILLAERIAELFWKLRRVSRFEAETLSQTHGPFATIVAHLQDRGRAQAVRERYVGALGELFRPNSHEIDDETLRTIFAAITELLSDGAERALFCDGGDDAMMAFLGGSPPRSMHRIGAVRAFLASAEDRLLRCGGATRAFAGNGENLTAQAYMYWERCRQQWHQQSVEADRGKAEMRTHALLLDAERAAIIDRYEPRLRRDLSRTLRELLDLQDHRIDDAARRGDAYGPLREMPLSRNEPKAILPTDGRLA